MSQRLLRTFHRLWENRCSVQFSAAVLELEQMRQLEDEKEKEAFLRKQAEDGDEWKSIGEGTAVASATAVYPL